MILSDKNILMYNKCGILVEQELKNEQIQPNSIDLTLAGTVSKIESNFFVGTQSTIDLKIPINYINDKFDEFYYLQSHEFVLMASNEILVIPNKIVGIVCGRSSLARVGLVIENAGFIDSGFNGTITLELYNQTNYPIKLYKDMRIAQVYFMEANQSEKLYNGKYNGQIEATGSRIDKDFKG